MMYEDEWLSPDDELALEKMGRMDPLSEIDYLSAAERRRLDWDEADIEDDELDLDYDEELDYDYEEDEEEDSDW